MEDWSFRFFMSGITLFVAGIYLALFAIGVYILKKLYRKAPNIEPEEFEAAIRKSKNTLGFYLVFSLCNLSFSILYRTKLPSEIILKLIGGFAISVLLVQILGRKLFWRKGEFSEFYGLLEKFW